MIKKESNLFIFIAQFHNVKKSLMESQNYQLKKNLLVSFSDILLPNRQNEAGENIRSSAKETEVSNSRNL